MRLGLLLVASSALPAGLGAATASRFTQLSVEHGLSQSTVQVILQDHVGFVWLGTEEGLNRYDGYSFVVFKHDPGDPKSLPDDRIFALHEDRQQRLWVGTEVGLALFDRRTETFTRVPSVRQRINGIVEDPDGRLWLAAEGLGLFERNPSTGTFLLHENNPQDASSLGSTRVSTLLRDRAGRLWVGTRDRGLERLERPGRTFVHHRHDPANPRSLGHDEVWGLAEDAQGNVWVATYGGGLSVLDHAGEFRHHRHRPDDPQGLRTDLLTSVLTERSGRIWIGTDGAGVQHYDPANGRFTALPHPGEPGSRSGEVVRSLYEDLQGQLWVGTFLAGVHVLKRPRAFGYFTHRPSEPDSLSDPEVAAFLEDPQGRIWMGTERGWLNRFDRATDTFVRYRVPSTPSGSAVLSLHRDRRGRIWLGTYRSGLYRFDPDRGRFEVHRHRPGDPRSLIDDEVWAIAEDEDGTLWLGTNLGLDRFDPERGIVTEHLETLGTEGVSSIGVRSLLVDGQGNLWVGTLGGLNLRLKGGGGFVRYRHDEKDPTSLSNNGIFVLHEDRRGQLWVGTFGGGLNRFDPVAGAFKSYRHFPSNVIFGIEEDDAGRLWVSTNHGLSRFDPAKGQTDNFDLTNGLLSLQFHLGASLKTRAGRLLFGSVNGFYDFDPHAIEPDTYAPPVVMTDVRVFGEPARTPASVTTVDEVTLSHRDRVLSLEFAALDYTMPRRNQYVYQLQGLSDQWIPLGSRREVTFTNLDPGSYVFRVKASNSDGIWNDASTARLRIVATPAVWETWWFRALGLAAFALALLAAARIRERYRSAHLAERRRAELAVREAEGRYRSIFDNAVEGIFQSTPEGRFLTVNPAMARMLGYASAAEMLADVTSIERQFYSPGQRQAFLQRLEAQGAVHEFEHEVRRKDGRTIWVCENARVVHDEAGQVLYYEGTAEDVTDRHRAREAERALHEGLAVAALEWERTFDAIDALVVVLDEHGKVRRINRIARDLFPGVGGSFVGRRLTELGPGEPWAVAGELAREVAYTAERARSLAHDRASGRAWEVTVTPLPGFEDEGHTIVVARQVRADGAADP